MVSMEARRSDPNFAPDKIRIARDSEGIFIQVNGTKSRVARVACAFPRTDPDHYVSFLDEMGHELGVIEDPSRLDAESRTFLKAVLKEIYFVPTISEVQSVTTQGIAHRFGVATDDGDREFTVENLDALDGSHPPGILIRGADGKRYQIDDYWELDGDSRERMSHMVPRRVLQARYGRSMMGGSSRGRGRGSGRGGSSSSSGGMMRFG